MNAYQHCLHAVRSVAAVWAITTFTIMTVAVLAQVGGRYFFNYSIASSAEIATISQIWMVLVGTGIATRQGAHARIDALVKMFPLGVRRAFIAGTAFLGVVFLLAVIVGAIPMLKNGQYQSTPTLGLPMWIPYLGLIVGPAYFAAEVVDLAVREWSGEETASELIMD